MGDLVRQGVGKGLVLGSGDGSVGVGRVLAELVGAGRQTPVVVVGGRDVHPVDRLTGGVVLLQYFRAGLVGGRARLAEGLVVEVGAGVGDRVRGSGVLIAAPGALEDEGARSQLRGCAAGTGGVREGSTQPLVGTGQVALVVDVEDAGEKSVLLIGGGAFADPPGDAVGEFGAAGDLACVHHAGGDGGHAGGLGAGGGGLFAGPGGGDLISDDGAAVAVVGLGLADEAREVVLVLDGAAVGVGDVHAALGAVGEDVAVHAAQERGDGLGARGLGAVAVAGAGGDGGVAAELVPGSGLGVRELGVIAVPGDAAAVLVVGDDAGLAGDHVLLGDRLDDDLVEPVVDRVGEGLVGQVPLDRHAAHRVGVRGGGHGALDAGALRGLVDDVDAATGLGGDLLDARPVERGGGGLGAVGTLDRSVDPVGDLLRQPEGHGRDIKLGPGVGRAALDGLQPQRRCGAVTRGLKALLEVVGVDVAVAAGAEDLCFDLRQALGGEVGGRQAQALSGGRALLVDRRVAPCGRVGLALGRVAGGGGFEAAVLDVQLDLGGGVGLALGGDLVGQALAVADPGRVGSSLVEGGGAVAVVLTATACVVVVLLPVAVGDQVLVRVDDIVEVPLPAQLLPGAVGGSGRAQALVLAAVEVDGDCGDGVGLRVGAVAAGQAVGAEVVLGAVGRGDLEGLALPGRVPLAGQSLDLRAVVTLEPVLAGGVVADDLAGVAGHREGEDVAGPALVTRVLDAGILAAPVRTRYRAGVPVPALTDQAGLRVRGRRTAVDRGGVVPEHDARRRAGDRRWDLGRVAVREVPRVPPGLP